jgi:hypothetical protein
MLDAAQKRAALIEHLESARGIASELGDGTTEHLIERAMDQARVDQVPGERRARSSCKRIVPRSWPTCSSLAWPSLSSVAPAWPKWGLLFPS